MKRSLVVLALLAVAGCSENVPPPKAPVAQVRPVEPVAPLDSKSPSRGVVHIAEDIRKACGIADSDAHFAFDSARLEETDRPVLVKLVTCFVSGPLKGRDMSLVGHADPRGAYDYNMVLGGSRADTVKGFLDLKGMPSTRVAVSSRGELDAQGTDERSWAEDRRVDIRLR